jgi:hypothetical protein
MIGERGFKDLVLTQRTCPFCNKTLFIKLIVPAGDRITEFNLIANELDKHYSACPANQGRDHVHT